MPRRRPQRRSRRYANSTPSMSPGTAGPTGTTMVTIRGKANLLFDFVAGQTISVTQLSLIGLANARFNELAEAYQMFRFTDISVCLIPYVPTGMPATNLVSFAYTPGQATAPTSYLDAYQLNDSMVVNWTGAASAGKRFILRVPRNVLITQNASKWYRTQPSASLESWEENQGTFFLNLQNAATGTFTIYTQMSYTLQLAGSVTSSMIPAPIIHFDNLAVAVRKAIPQLALLDRLMLANVSTS